MMDKSDNVSSPLVSKQGDLTRSSSKLGPLEMEGIGLDLAILYSIDCCGKHHTTFSAFILEHSLGGTELQNMQKYRKHSETHT